MAMKAQTHGNQQNGPAQSSSKPTSAKPVYSGFGASAYPLTPAGVLQLQRAAGNQAVSQLLANSVQRRSKNGLPDRLKSGVEALSGISLDNVSVHYNSPKPAQVGALAYAQGSEIHMAPGQEQHLPHEAWHVVQQRQGRVQATRQLKTGAALNDDDGLEHEADVMGEKATNASEPGSPQTETTAASPTPKAEGNGVIQRVTEHDGWQTEHTFTPIAKNALTPYGAIVNHYGASKLKLGELKNLLGSDVLTADIPGHSTATKTGGASNSNTREGGSVETLVKRMGDSEKTLKGKAGKYPYAGGHLIAYNILEDASNEAANIAPQAAAFNAPVYFNLFEKVSMGSIAPITIDVNVAYRQIEYKVQTRYLISKKILDASEELKSNVSIPARIPYRWDATVHTTEETGLGAEGNKTPGMQGMVTTDEDEFNKQPVGQGAKTGYKLKVNQGGKKQGTSIFTGGMAKKLSISAEQQDFPQTSTPPEPQQVSSPAMVEDDPGKKKKLSQSDVETSQSKKQKKASPGESEDDIEEEPTAPPTEEIEMGEAEDEEEITQASKKQKGKG
jgi:hypothetical protein